MKTNLDSLFKTDNALEKEGVWFMVSEEAGFLVRRFGGANASKVKQAIAKYYKPYSRQVENGTIAAEKEKEILVTSFVEASMVDWKGIEIDGEIVPYSREVAIKFFCALPELFEAIYSYATAVESYKEDLGNS
jgi:hypothetical protein